MRTIQRLLSLLIVCSTGLWADQRAEGWCEQGGQRAVVSGVSSSTYVQRSYPACTVTVYLVGTLTLATISQSDGGAPSSNPFQASNTGFWAFYADDGRYDVRLSGAGIATPFTLGDIQLFDASGGGGSVDGGANLTSAGQVVIVSAAATVTQDSSGLFCWDLINHRINIGMACGGTRRLNVTGPSWSSDSTVSSANLSFERPTADVASYLRFAHTETPTTYGAYLNNTYDWYSTSYRDATASTGFGLSYALGGLAFRSTMCTSWTASADYASALDVGICRNGTDELSISSTGATGNATGKLTLGTVTATTGTITNLTVTSCTGCTGAGGYATIQDEGSSLTQRATLNFIGSAITCVDATTKTNCTITAGGGASFPVTDNNVLFSNFTDPTKTVQYSLAALGAGVAAIWSYPNTAAATFAGIGLSQTYSGNNTYSGVNTFSGASNTFNSSIIETSNMSLRDTSGIGTGIKLLFQQGTTSRFDIDNTTDGLFVNSYNNAGASPIAMVTFSRNSGGIIWGGDSWTTTRSGGFLLLTRSSIQASSSSPALTLLNQTAYALDAIGTSSAPDYTVLLRDTTATAGISLYRNSGTTNNRVANWTADTNYALSVYSETASSLYSLDQDGVGYYTPSSTAGMYVNQSGSNVGLGYVQGTASVARPGASFVSTQTAIPALFVGNGTSGRVLRLSDDVGGSAYIEGWVASGSPESIITANTGSFYFNRSGGAGTTLYVKQSGAGNTGWVGLGTGSSQWITSGSNIYYTTGNVWVNRTSDEALGGKLQVAASSTIGLNVTTSSTGFAGAVIQNTSSSGASLLSLATASTSGFETLSISTPARTVPMIGMTAAGNNAQIFAGAATPEGAVSAGPGSVYLRTNGGASTSLYVKESGTGNTGWVAK